MRNPVFVIAVLVGIPAVSTLASGDQGYKYDRRGGGGVLFYADFEQSIEGQAAGDGDGRLVLGVCRNNNDPKPTRRQFEILVYESQDEGLTWQEIGETPLCEKEPSLTALLDGKLVLTAQGGYFGPGAKLDEMPLSRSEDGGRTWETTPVPGPDWSDYPRNPIVEPDGSLLMVRALLPVLPDWNGQGGGSPNLRMGRSKDQGKTWQVSERLIDWDCAVLGEVAAIRCRDGRLLVALRRQIPGTWGEEGYQDTVFTDSIDDGRHWSRPWQMTNVAEVHAYLTELNHGRILATHSNYHLPWGVYAVVSRNSGKTWDLTNPTQLALSTYLHVCCSVILQSSPCSRVTCYAATTYNHQPPDIFTREVVPSWRV